ncbi:MAG: 30S ribosomal protein S9, partial [Planctomycetes bacterium]|nr:30S ribosomal protein S9 [Planctomycetota bacterium]
MAEVTYIWGTGRRKTSVARVRLKPGGNGAIVVNERDMEKFFTRESERLAVRAPLKATRTLNKYDVLVNVAGGGVTGQAGA